MTNLRCGRDYFFLLIEQNVCLRLVSHYAGSRGKESKSILMNESSPIPFKQASQLILNLSQNCGSCSVITGMQISSVKTLLFTTDLGIVVPVCYEVGFLLTFRGM